MNLKSYLDVKSITYSAFARQIGTSAEAVRRYAERARVPTQDVMRRIHAVTEGAVQPNDFFDLPPARQCDGRPALPTPSPPSLPMTTRSRSR